MGVFSVYSGIAILEVKQVNLEGEIFVVKIYMIQCVRYSILGGISPLRALN